MTLFHYYTYFKNLKEIDPLELSVACVYLACKNQYCLIPMDKVVEMYNKVKEIRKETISTNKVPDFLKYEIEIYSFLGYDLNIETPYCWFYKFIVTKQGEGLGEEKIKNFLFNIINDTYRKSLCLFYHPKIIMLSAMVFTVKFLELENVKVDNLILDENLDDISECMNNIFELFEGGETK